MAITIEQSASLNSNAYNRVEYVISSDNSAISKFKYLTNVLYDVTTITSHQAIEFNSTVYTELGITTNYFVVGDKVFIEGNGNYDVLAIDTTANTIIVDSDYNDVFNNITISTSTVSKVIAYKIDKESTQDLGVIDYSNTLKNFCTQLLYDNNGLYWSPEVIQTYKLAFGEESLSTYAFLDNISITGSKTGFINTSLSASYTSSTTFNIGDKVNVQQDLYEWLYTDNKIFSNRVGFTGSLVTSGLFPSQSQVFVTEQITNPSYNGYSSVYSSSTNEVILDKDWIGNTPVESGSMFGHIKPTYNVVTTITDIYYDTGSNGIVFSTDIDWAGNSPAIGGNITLANGNLSKVWETPTDLQLVSTGKFDNLQSFAYSPESFHIKSGSISSTYLASTVISFNLPGTYRHRVEQNTKSWILAKPGMVASNVYNSGSIDVAYSFYNSSGTLLGTGSFDYVGGIDFITDQNALTDPADYYGLYIPNGLDQLNASTNFSSSLSSYISTVDHYALNITGSWGSTQTVTFEINEDCDAGYGVYSLLFKDSLGSFISYPFKYKSIDSTETDAKTYYKKEGKLNPLTPQMDYTTHDRGKTNLYKRYNDKMKLTSGWVNDEENIIIKDLLTSPDVYLQDDENNLIAVQVLNTDVELGKSMNTSIYNYTIDISYSIDQLRY